MKKIGIEVQRLFRKKKHGMEVVAFEILKELLKIDSTNKYTLFVKDGDDKCLEENENFSIKILPGKTYFDWEQFTLPKAVKVEKLDFLHSTCNTSALNVKIPLLLTLHDIIYLEQLNFKGTPYQNFGNIYRRVIVPKVVRKSKYIITVSHYEKKSIMQKLNIPDEKVKVIYNAVNKKFNNNFPTHLIDAFKMKHGLPEHFILFLGNTAPKKNTKNVIEAYIKYSRSVTNPEKLVILDYQEKLAFDFLEKNNALDLKNNLIFPGFITSDEMPLIYNSASLFLYPSLRESFGLPILEAMACGTPVITSNTSSMPEVGGSAAIYVNPYDVDNIAQMIEMVLNNKILQKELADKGVARAAEFTWGKAATDLLEIYKKM